MTTPSVSEITLASQIRGLLRALADIEQRTAEMCSAIESGVRLKAHQKSVVSERELSQIYQGLSRACEAIIGVQAADHFGLLDYLDSIRGIYGDAKWHATFQWFKECRSALIALEGSVPSAPEIISTERINQLREIKHVKFDLSKLIAICDELNLCYANSCLIATAALIRTLLDHVPPIFGCEKFSDIANHYMPGKSASRKAQMQHLENFARKIADDLLHRQIQNKELLPNATQMSFAPALDTLLQEVILALHKDNDA